MIPKIIHYCWLGNIPYPEKIACCVNSWKKHLSDYKLMRWDESSFDINSVQWVREAYKAKKYAFASDYIRFFALYRYGGVYLDTDVEAVKSFDSLLSNRSFIGFEYVSIPESAVIGTEPELPWIKECLDYYRDKSFYDRRGGEKTVAVPIMIKTVLRNFYGKPVYDDSKIQDLGDCVLYPYQYFSPRDPYRNRINISDDTYCVHYAVASWCGRRSGVNRLIHLILRFLLRKRIYDELLYRYHLRKVSEEFKNGEDGNSNGRV
jgi:hypothetical protein